MRRHPIRTANSDRHCLPDVLSDQMVRQGFCVFRAIDLSAILHLDLTSCKSFSALWDDLPEDEYLLDGGHYRFRRHGSFSQEFGATEARLRAVPQRAHWQPKNYNTLHGGLRRWFAPLPEALTHSPIWESLLLGLGRCFTTLRPSGHWFIEAHQFRITTDGGEGRPTPEGAHRDGVDFIAIILFRRQEVHGGETRILANDQTELQRVILTEPCSALLLDDTLVIHETSPILPISANGRGWRDTLVLTYRADGFLDPAS